MRINVRYTGPALASGRMDVRQLAPAMASVAQLVDDAARLLFGQEAEARIEISGDFRRGSFAYEFFAVPHGALNPDELKNLLEWIGLIATSSGVSGVTLFQVIKWLRGRKARKMERLPGNNVEIHAGDGSIVAPIQIANLVVNYQVRNAVEGITEPLARQGIDSVEIGEKGAEPAVEITRQERELFLAPPPDAEPLHKATSETVLQVVSPVFKVGNKWQFAYPGEASFHAAILDKAFLQRMQNREVVFGFGDLIRAEVRTSVSRSEGGKLSTEREIVKVNEVLPPAQQTDLFTSDDEG